FFKRSFYSPDVEKLPDGLSWKVLPFGLNYSTRTSGSTRRLAFAAAARLMEGGRRLARSAASHLHLPGTVEFGQWPDSPIDQTIVFQTRVWEEDDAEPGESEVINESRVQIVRALREAFGDRFRGGLVPTPLALERYPNEVSPFPSRRKLYTRMSKK